MSSLNMDTVMSWLSLVSFAVMGFFIGAGYGEYLLRKRCDDCGKMAIDCEVNGTCCRKCSHD